MTDLQDFHNGADCSSRFNRPCDCGLEELIKQREFEAVKRFAKGVKELLYQLDISTPEYKRSLECVDQLQDQQGGKECDQEHCKGCQTLVDRDLNNGELVRCCACGQELLKGTND